ncbi:MAG: cell division protein FtsZ, partial [Oscillospiraceae bacterium]
GARGVIISITSSPDIGLEEVEEAATLITSSAHPEANIIWGAAFDVNLVDEIKITVVATGFEDKPMPLDDKKQKSQMTQAQNQAQSRDTQDDLIDAKSILNSDKSLEDDNYLNDVISILKRNSGH